WSPSDERLGSRNRDVGRVLPRFAFADGLLRCREGAGRAAGAVVGSHVAAIARRRAVSAVARGRLRGLNAAACGATCRDRALKVPPRRVARVPVALMRPIARSAMPRSRVAKGGSRRELPGSRGETRKSTPRVAVIDRCGTLLRRRRWALDGWIAAESGAIAATSELTDGSREREVRPSGRDVRS